MVTYLTDQGEDYPADQETMPERLLQALQEVDSSNLVPLAYMNVIVPTAMATMHEDPNFSAQSEQTATRGTRVLTALKAGNDPVENHCRAIVAIATGEGLENVDPAKITYWMEFLKRQREDISRAIRGDMTN